MRYQHINASESGLLKTVFWKSYPSIQRQKTKNYRGIKYEIYLYFSRIKRNPPFKKHKISSLQHAVFSSDGKMRIDVCGTNICCYIIQTNTPINELPHHNIVPLWGSWHCPSGPLHFQANHKMGPLCNTRYLISIIYYYMQPY